jgi:CheY-specific phosphatase CheX
LADEDPRLSHALVTAVTSTLQHMASTAVEVRGSDETPSFDKTLIHAHITFSGHGSGELGMLMEPGLAAQLASRVLGVDGSEPLIQEMVLDAVKELLNVICGQFLTFRFGEEPVFSLGVPRVFPLGAQACNMLVSGSPILVFQCGASILPVYVRFRESA